MSSSKAVVLIVKDEPLAPFSTPGILEEVGHVALEAGNADEAMILFRNRSDIDIVVTDIDATGPMDGIQFAQRVRAVKSGVGIIIASDSGEPDPMLLPANTVFLAKPYQQEKLLSSIHSLLA